MSRRAVLDSIRLASVVEDPVSVYDSGMSRMTKKALAAKIEVTIRRRMLQAVQKSKRSAADIARKSGVSDDMLRRNTGDERMNYYNLLKSKTTGRSGRWLDYVHSISMQGKTFAFASDGVALVVIPGNHAIQPPDNAPTPKPKQIDQIRQWLTNPTPAIGTISHRSLKRRLNVSRIPNIDQFKCQDCKGHGTVERYCVYCDDHIHTTPCDQCNGSGYVTPLQLGKHHYHFTGTSSCSGYPEVPTIEIAGRHFSALSLFNALYRLPAARITLEIQRTPHGTPLRLRTTKWMALVMPLKKSAYAGEQQKTTSLIFSGNVGAS